MFYHYAGNNPVKYTDPTGEYTTYGVLLAGVCYVGAAACCCIAVASAGTGQIYITPGATLVALFLVSAGGTILAADANNVNYAKSNHKEHGKSKGKPEAKPADEPSPVPKDGAESGKESENERPPLEHNKKHHPNSRNPEPKNAEDMYNNSVPDKKGNYWYKDKSGNIHRYQGEKAGDHQARHWNGSTHDKPPIRSNNIPPEISEMSKGDIDAVW